MFKKLLFSTLIVPAVLISYSAAYSCSSFAVYGKKPIYGMNFDYDKFPMKFIISQSDKIKTFHLAFQRPVNKTKIWACTSGMNDKGLFGSCQEEHPQQKTAIPPKKNDMYIHSLYLQINHLQKTDEIEKLCSSKRLINYNDVTAHNLFADKTGKALITEASKNGNEIIKTADSYMVMTNFQNRKIKGKSYEYAEGAGAERYKIAHEFIKKQNKNLNIESAMILLKKLNNKTPGYPTHCSMVFDPEKNEIYAVIERNYEKIFRISLNKSTIETFKGFKQHKVLNLDSNGVLFSTLSKL